MNTEIWIAKKSVIRTLEQFIQKPVFRFPDLKKILLQKFSKADAPRSIGFLGRVLKRNSKTGCFESELLFNTFFENSWSPMWIADCKSLRIIDINQGALMRYGNTMHINSCKNLYDMIDLDGISIVKSFQSGSFENQMVFKAELREAGDHAVFIELMINTIRLQGKMVYLIRQMN